MYRKYHPELDSIAVHHKAMDALKAANFDHPKVVMRKFPHELSGGMCQRLVILLALASDPDLVIADEPTTALDVVMQQAILKLLFQERQNRQLSLLFVTHDARLLRENFDKIAVLCGGYLVEWGNATCFFRQDGLKNHPYTRILFPGLGGKQLVVWIWVIRSVAMRNYVHFTMPAFLRMRPATRCLRFEKSSQAISFDAKTYPKPLRHSLHNGSFKANPIVNLSRVSMRFPLKMSWGDTNKYYATGLTEVDFKMMPGER